MSTWAATKVTDLRKELKRRDLPLNGRKATLVARLEHTDGLPRDRSGRASHYKEEVKRHEEAALAELATFPYFARLPLELQRMIWIFSLPGPRVLRYHNNGPCCEHKLFFRKDWQPPNPAALFTCRESRAIALKRYKLCFGTSNIYADLPGGDILYLSRPDLAWEWQWVWIRSRINGTRRTIGPTNRLLCSEVMHDLAAVTHVILPGQFWHRSSVPPYVSTSDGSFTRRMLTRFKSLTRVSLATVESSDPNRAFVGYNTVSDRITQMPKELDLDTRRKLIQDVFRFMHHDRNAVDEWSIRRQEILGDPIAVGFLSGYDFCQFPQGIKPTVCEVKIVELDHVVCMPPRVEEHYAGYPVDWCCETAVSEDEAESPRRNARYNLRRA